jgi:hypothetical protein
VLKLGRDEMRLVLAQTSNTASLKKYPCIMSCTAEDLQDEAVS